MELANEFEVESPIDDVWDVFLDVERVAVCLPGAQFIGVDGDEYQGIIKVKVGPITTQYKGVAKIIEQDESAKKMVLKAEGRDSKGAGNASATINIALAEEGTKTKVAVSTDLTVTGKVAQFGRGVMDDISAKLMEQFADNLREVLGGNVEIDDPTKTEAVDILEGSSKRVKALGNVAGTAMKIGQGIKKMFKSKPKQDGPQDDLNGNSKSK